MNPDAIHNLQAFVEQQLPLLKPVEKSWQPSDVLPDLTGEDWREKVRDCRERAATLSDEALVVLVGNMVTEEALPSYQTWLNRNTEIRDETGTGQTPWALWTRGWTAEENRHGEVMSRYLYLSGRVNMRAVEVTIQHLIRNGFDLKSDNDLYKSLVYTSFQERATKISHANTGRLARRCGDEILSKMCVLISGDEARHEEAYKRFFGNLIEFDPDRAVCAFGAMMRQQVVMPARLMSDGIARDLFTQFAVVAQRSKVYTSRDYAEVIQHLLEFWNIAALKGLSGEAAEAQEYLCGLPARYLSKAERVEGLINRMPKERFSWLFDRAV